MGFSLKVSGLDMWEINKVLKIVVMFGVQWLWLLLIWNDSDLAVEALPNSLCDFAEKLKHSFY